ncbi:ribosomal subunit interface protein [bacterium]|nr:ribosomal subunit interface protein [bacterium]|tara:strand:+ start:1120 stop:1488 length:369 start_codon:yes stop_codon:yes gene_type:complete
MIKTNVKYTNYQATPDVELYLQKKLDKIGEVGEQYQDEVILRVEIGKSTDHHQKGEIFRAEIQTHVNGRDARAVSETEDIFTSIDEAKDKLVQEILKDKEKQDTLMRKGGRKIKNLLKGFYK